MKKFLLKGICFILLLFGLDIIGGGVFALLHKMACERSPYGMLTEYAMDKVNSEVLIIGASTANHHYVTFMLRDSLGMDVHNCGKDGSGFLYQCCVIDGILRRTAPKMIIWDMEPDDLSDPSTKQLDRLSAFNPYYDTNDYCRELIDSKGKWEKYKMLSGVYRYNSRLLAYMYKSIMPYAYPEDGYLPLPSEGYVYPSLIDEKIEKQFDTGQEEYLRDIIQKCKKKEIRLVVSLSPRLRRSNYRETEVFNRLCELLDKEHVVCLDYYNDKFFLDNSTLFKDNAHLNDRGARLFTALFSEKIRQLESRSL